MRGLWIGLCIILGGCGGGSPAEFGAALVAAPTGTGTSPLTAENARPMISASAQIVPARSLQSARLLSPQSAPLLSADALFDWAEKFYPQFFHGSAQAGVFAPYQFRFYPAAGNYLAVANGGVYVLGPVSGGSILKVGELADFTCAVLTCTNALPASFYTIETYAGNGALNVGDGGPATSAQLLAPERVLVSSAGTVYIADTNNNRIAAVDTNGIIKTFAGRLSAENQPLGDGGPATDAIVRFPRALYETADGVYIGDHSYTIRLVDSQGSIKHAALNTRLDFILPWSIAVDKSKNIYIADITQHRVLRVDPNGVMTTIAGTGEAGNTGDNGLGITARLNKPSQLRFDGQGRLLIGSSLAPLRQLDLNNGVITTRLMHSMPYFDIESTGAFVYSRGNQIVRVDAGTGVETVVAGLNAAGFSGDGGAAIAAQFRAPSGVSVDSIGNIFVADSQNNRIRKINPAGIISTFAGNGASPASLDGVTDTQGLGFDNQGNLFFTDFSYHYLRRVTGRRSEVVAGSGLQASGGDGGVASAAAFSNPATVAFDKFGQMFFFDLAQGTGSVRMIKPGSDGVIRGSTSEVITTVAGRSVDRTLSDNGNADGGPAKNAVFSGARDFLFDSKGNLIIADWLGNRVRKVVPGADGIFNGGTDEVITTIAGNGSIGQSGDGGAATNASLEAPLRLAIDATDNIFVYSGVNTSKAAIRRIDAKTGSITTIAANVPVAYMIVSHMGDLIYSTGVQVIKIDLSTLQRTVIAGSGARGFSGDGGDARSATFRGASYLAVDSADNVYVADNGNFRIRRLLKPR